MSNKKIYSRFYRMRIAYGTAIVVMFSYLKLYLAGKIFGKSYYEKRIGDLHARNAERVKKTIVKLQGLFIKVGQLLSNLTNLLPESLYQHLEVLQDQIPARPFQEIEQSIIKSLGKKPLEIFETFNETPLAAASIGQTHRATLKNGTEVVVKIQHNNIEKIADVDLNIMERLIRIFSRFYKIKGMEHAYEQVRQMIEEELDFRKEASFANTIRENLKDENRLIIPEVYPELSGERVMTTTFCEGVKISDTKQLDEWKVDRRDIGNRLVHAFCQMLFKDGIYHADPHPGNILVQKDGTIVLLDFGAVATLQPMMRTGILELIDAVVNNDQDNIIAVMKKLGFLADGKAAEEIAEKAVDAFRHFLQNEVQFDGLSLKDIKVNPFETSLFNLISEVGIQRIMDVVQVPKDYVLLNRMVTLLAGVCNTLDSQMNPLEVVKPYFQEFMLGEKGDLLNYVKDLVQKTLTNVLTLPVEMQKVLKKAKKGELEIKVAGSNLRSQLYYTLGQQLIFSIVMIAAGGFGFLFYTNGETKLLNYSFSVGGLFVFLFLRAIWKGRKLKRRLEDY